MTKNVPMSQAQWGMQGSSEDAKFTVHEVIILKELTGIETVILPGPDLSFPVI